MSLQATIADITTRLRQGKFPNEQSISQGIVLRLLAELGWKAWDTNVVWPEYQTGKGRADFALCHPPRDPAVFIEVKQPGKAEDAVEQALNYAFHTGVPFVVLTDGRTWSFYLPAERGSFENRCVHKLDLYEHTAEQAEKILQDFLLQSRVESREALEYAQTEYRTRNKRARAKSVIPDAWRELVEMENQRLVEILAEAVKTRIGIRPDANDVAIFLRSLKEPSPKPQTSPSKSIFSHPLATAQNTHLQRTKTNLRSRNGVHQPKEGTLTRTIWDVADKLTAKKGRPARRREVVAALPNVKFSTLHTQYFRWRNFHGIEGRLC